MLQRQPISAIAPVSDWQSVPIRECGEPLVNLANLHPRILPLAEYQRRGFKSATADMLVREKVANLLALATQKLPHGISLGIYDGWRAVELQQEIFSAFYARLKQLYPEKNDDDVTAETQKYVSLPQSDPKRPSPHLTGGAVDVTLCDNNGNVEMGTGFDHFGREAGTRFLEIAAQGTSRLKRSEAAALRNRRILFHALIGVGFTNYEEEWWHYDYGNQFWAKSLGHTALYGPTSP
jgi:D-alanyl-D-alanine dipeptidase